MIIKKYKKKTIKNLHKFLISHLIKQDIHIYMLPIAGQTAGRGRESRVPQIVITATQICFAASALLKW